MTLATMLFGLLMLAKGITLFTMRGEKALKIGMALLRDRRIEGGLLGVATAWFLWVVLHLGQADFGDYKILMFIIFLGVAVGAWFYVKDFLGVRAACAIYMLLSWQLLGAAFGRYDVPARLFMVSGIYVGLVFALYLAAAPYRARDLLEWFTQRPVQARVLGGSLAIYGAWLLLIPLMFY